MRDEIQQRMQGVVRYVSRAKTSVKNDKLAENGKRWQILRKEDERK